MGFQGLVGREATLPIARGGKGQEGKGAGELLGRDKQQGGKSHGDSRKAQKIAVVGPERTHLHRVQGSEEESSRKRRSRHLYLVSKQRGLESRTGERDL